MFRMTRRVLNQVRGLIGAVAVATILSAMPARAAEPAQVEPPKVARILPDTTLALFVAEGISTTRERYKETVIWKLWEEPEVQAFFEPIIPKIEAILEKGEEMGEFKFADIPAAFGGQVALAFVGLDTRREEPLPEIALIADITDRAAASRLLARIGRAVNEAEGTDAEYTTWQAGPLTFGRISEEGEPMEAGYVLTDSVLYVAMGPEGNLLKSLVAAARNGQPDPIADDPDFQKAVERAGERRDLFGYVQVNRIRELVFAIATEMGGPADELDKGKRVLDALGLSDVRSVSFVEAVDPPGFRSQMFVHAPSPRKGVFDLISREPVRDSMLKLAPSKATSLFAFRLRMDKLLPLVRKVAGVVEPGAAQQIDMMLGQMKQGFGLDIEKSVIEGLGLEGAVIVDPVAGAGLGPQQGLAGLALVMRAADPESFQPVYAMVTALAQAQAQANGMAVTSTQTPDGAVVTSVAMPQLAMAGVTPAITMTRGHVVIGLSVEAVTRISRTLAGNVPEPLVEADDYRRSLARAGVEPGWLVSFGRPATKEDFDPLLQYAPMASPFLASAAGRPDMPKDLGDLLRAIDLTNLPSGSTLAKHGLAQIGIGWQDDDGIGVTGYGPVGLSAASVAVTGIGAAAVIPALGRARSRARRTVCTSNLKQVGLALQLYAGDNGGSYPATLGALLPDYLNDPSILRCPESGTAYSYVSGLKQSDRASVIVAFDAPGNHGNGANVLRVGGSVSWQRLAYRRRSV